MTKRIMTTKRLKNLRYYAAGNVTVGIISQVEEKQIRSFFVGKVRGKIVSSIMTNGEEARSVWKFDTEDEARSHAWAWRESHRRELARYEKRIKRAQTLLATIDSTKT